MPTIVDDRVPVAVGLCLIVGCYLERKRLAVLELRSAIEADTGDARNGEFDNQGIARFAIRIVGRCGNYGANTAVREGFGIEAGGFFCVVVIPHTDRVLGHLVNSF